ncbi:hypothetical protein [Ohessyouella blattaphilus]|uniref:Lipoprotein n=1 Tax=Ohessyouella blattaphilus TaxID=2949333 RepID=A0ABT1EGP9_9FIRM|nr:hypothetical protein [Ohessyouella blattaphilus]MCP1109874.1 hypothetical protein [Ohessyouella blattaphilus]MCR8563268.1 hypothetical protein [Ohessyouella blattaphilus]
MRKKLIAIIGLVAIILSLWGCQRTLGNHTGAIEAEFDRIVMEEHELSTFMCEDLKQQVKEQIKEDKEKAENKATTYTIKVKVPDLSKVAMKDVDIELPDSTLGETTSSAYEQEYRDKARQKLEEMITKDKGIDWQNRIIEVTLTKQEEGWKCSLPAPEAQALAGAASQGISDKIYAFLDEDLEYHKLRVAESMDEILAGVFTEQEYLDTIEVEDVSVKEHGFTAKITYKDPEKLYGRIMDAYVEAKSKEGQHIFKEISYESGYSEITAKIGDAIADISDTKEAEFFIEKANEGYSLGYNDQNIMTEAISDKRTAIVKEAVDKINKACVIPEQPRPGTSVLSQSGSGSPISISSSGDVPDKHLTFINESGAEVLKAFVKKGESLSVSLPPGNYRLIQGWGDTWYGNDHAFGPGGTYQESSDIIGVQGGYTYTLTLYNVADGNLGSRGIDYPY